MNILALDVGYSTGLVEARVRYGQWHVLNHQTIQLVKDDQLEQTALRELKSKVLKYAPYVAIEYPFWDCGNSGTPLLNCIKGWLMAELFDVEYVEVYPSDWKNSFAVTRFDQNFDPELFNGPHERDAAIIAYYTWRKGLV